MSAARIPALDGVRGLAIVLVLLGHTTAMAGGYVGVELFFVLSGYLITGILLGLRDRPDRWRTFYTRRALRIWPLYLLFLAVLWVVPLPSVYGDWLAAHGWWYWLHLANVGHAYVGNPPDNLTTHLWSLAVEEHYYLLWPAVIWALTRRQALLACGVVVALAVLARLYLPILPPWLNTALRLDAIAIGSALALIPASRRRYVLPLGVLAALPIAWAALQEPALLPKFDPRWVLWLQPAVGLLFAALLVYALERRPRWSEWAWLGWLGRVSYCVYLVHLPVAVLLRYRGWDGLPLFLAVTLSSCLIAAASWRWWESPWLALRALPARRSAQPSSVS
jgi:peptidoglycan/LPS O-acetylase OafA/YrhL